MVKQLATSLGLFLLNAGAAQADEAYDACMKKAVTNADFSECGGAYVKRADDALNAAWKQTYKLASGQTAKDLLAEEQAWIAYKEKSCLFYANSESGRQGQVIDFPGCRGAVIEQRTKELVGIGKDLASH
ncbi:MAG: DUF1311 domain-containing protein [Hyphomicrobiales bacterium]|jgi:uncharacterized protein YecT (DUF1311 family)|nr:DUF1311 domain-containing protein [Hyphomicrobiales bacterium]